MSKFSLPLDQANNDIPRLSIKHEERPVYDETDTTVTIKLNDLLNESA